MISDEEARQQIRKDLDASFAVDAGAGTGKTTLLIDRLAGVLLEKRIPLSRVAMWSHWTFNFDYENMTIIYSHEEKP